MKGQIHQDEIDRLEGNARSGPEIVCDGLGGTYDEPLIVSVRSKDGRHRVDSGLSSDVIAGAQSLIRKLAIELFWLRDAVIRGEKPQYRP